MVEEFEAIAPGYHMNKKHWITIALSGTAADAIANDTIKDLTTKSYELVVSNLTKVNRALLEQR